MTAPPQPTARLRKPTAETLFHIDYGWWDRQGRELRVYLQSHLCSEHQKQFASLDALDMIDWVNPHTAEVEQVDALVYTLRNHCARQSDYLTNHTSLIDAIFRVFLANGNQPLTPDELTELVNRPGQGQTILRTLSGRRVYKGLRPVAE